MKIENARVLKIYSEKELADALGLSQWTIRLWRLQAGLPHFRTSGRIFYRMEAVLRWMDEEERKNVEQSRVIL
jgi:hypothetical protein